MADKESRTEKATPRRREKHRQEGKVPVSRDVMSVAVLLFSGTALLLVLRTGSEQMATLMRTVLGRLDNAALGGAAEWPALSLKTAGMLLLPVAFAGLISTLASGFFQTGGLFTLKSLKLDLMRLNPLPKLKGMLFSKDTAVSLLQSMGKVAVIVGFTAQHFWQEMRELVHLSQRSFIDIMDHLWWALLSLGARVTGFLVLFAVLDVVITRRRHEKQIEMSKQEIREEHKEYEGNPEIKRRQRSRQMQLAKSRMMAQVPKADAVVVNPTHFAVAIRYDSVAMAAPQVTAKGQDEVAAAIREIARKHSVPVIHNPPLARALYAEVKLGHPVPVRLFAAVAEVLAYVYRLKGRAV